ncbi:MAG TPA: TIM barrel protein [Trebonia sp.]|jgi:sugar phosphate isomerase/epimerase
MSANAPAPGLTPNVLPELTLSAMTMRGRDFGDRVAAAAAAGYAGIGLTANDYRDTLAAGWTDDTMRLRLREHGVRVTEVESPWDWAGDPAQDEREQELLAHLAAAFAIDQLSVVLFARHDDDVMTRRLTRLCQVMAGARAGQPVQVALEFMPYSSLRTLADAWRVVRACPVGNLSLLVDNWHVQRSGGLSQLDAVPPEAVTSVQLDDVRDVPLADLTLESRYHRELPGRTAAGLLRRVLDLGSRPRLAVELMSGHWDRRPASEVAAATWAAAVRCIEEGNHPA